MAGIDFQTRSVPAGLVKNNGGLNTTASALNVQDNESTDNQNIDYDKFGSLLKRSGYATLNSSAFNSGAAWNSLHWFEMSDETDYLIGTCGNKIAKMDSLDGTWDDITGALTITAGNDNRMTWTTFLDTALGTNNVNVPVQWTGSGNASAATVPTGLTKAKFITVFQGYVHYTHVTVSGTAHKSRTYWSAQNSISSFDSADFRDINRNDGQTVTGVKVLGDRQVFFKERSIWIEQFTGDADIPFVFTKTPSHVGCIDGYSIQEIDNGLIFLSDDGYYFFDGLNSTKISDRITYTLTTTLEPNRFANSPSCYQKSKNRYWGAHSLSAGSTHNRIITFDSYNNAWGYYKGHAANCFAIATVNGQERVYFGDYDGFVYRADTGTNDNPLGVATAIDAYYYTKWFNFDDLVNKKGIPEVVIYYQITNATHTFSYSWDFDGGDQYSLSIVANTSSSVYGTALYDEGRYASAGGAEVRKDLTGRGRVIRLKFANNSLSETMQIDGFGLLPHLETAA